MEPLTDRSRWLADRLDGIAVSNGPPAGEEEGVVVGDQPDRLGDVGGVVELVARTLEAVHRLPVEGFPFDRGWEAIRERIETDPPVDAGELPEPYRRYDPATLRRLWSESRPQTEELVVCHGSPTLANMAFAHGAVVGLGGTDRLCVADRHLDLAIAQQSIQRQLGPEAVFVFYEAYGLEPDLLRLDHYVFASHLL